MAHQSTGGIKGSLKKVLPKSLLKKGIPVYHKLHGHMVAARHGYPARNLKVIGVTGTNGKTTTVSYIDSIMRAAGKKIAAYTTVYHRLGDEFEPVTDYNYTINPLQVNRFHQKAKKLKVDYLVQEVTSHALLQRRLAGIKYQAAVFTNLTYEHMEYHKDMEEYAHAKGLLFKGKPPVVVVNIDDEWGEKYFSKFESGRRKFLYGKSGKGNVLLKDIKLTNKGGVAKLEVDFKTITLQTRLVGEHNIYNAAGAALACYGLGVPIPAIEKGVRDLTAVAGRMAPIEQGQDFGVYTDYAHTPDGIEQVLKSLKAITKGKVTIVQSVYDGRDENKWPLLGEAAAKHADLIIVTDEEASKRPRADMRRAIISGLKKHGAEGKYLEIDDRETAVLEAIARAKKGDNVLIVPQGHLSGRDFYGFTFPGSDADLAKKALKTLGFKK